MLSGTQVNAQKRRGPTQMPPPDLKVKRERQQHSTDVRAHQGTQLVAGRAHLANVTSGGANPQYMTHGQGQMSRNRKANNTIMHPQTGIDPFGRVNSKARKVIESVERQRQTPADPRAGSTGGSFDEDLEFQMGNKITGKGI